MPEIAEEGNKMKAYFLFTAGGPLVILTSYESVIAPELLARLASKGIEKFVASEVPVELAMARYGAHFEAVCRDLHESDDLRILDYNGQRAFLNFRFSELASPIYHEPAESLAIGAS